MVATRTVFPDVRFGVGDRYLMRDVANTSKRDRAVANKMLFEMWKVLSPEIHCRLEGAVADELEILRGRGAQAVADFQAIEAARITEEECNGDVEPVLYAIYDTTLPCREQLVAAWQWYNIVFTGPNTLTARPFAIFLNFLRLGLPLEEVASLVSDVFEVFLSSEGLTIDGTLYRIEALKMVTAPNPILGMTRLDAVMEARAAEMDRRGADPRNPLQVQIGPTDWGGVERIVTWVPPA